MNGFDNAELKDKLYNRPVGEGFTPDVDYNYNAGTNTITVTDASVYAAGDGRKIVQIEVTDKNGKKKVANIAAADVDNAVAVDVAALDKSGGFHIAATVVTNKGLTSDGHASLIGIAVTQGSLGNWNVQDTSLS